MLGLWWPRRTTSTKELELWRIDRWHRDSPAWVLHQSSHIWSLSSSEGDGENSLTALNYYACNSAAILFLGMSEALGAMSPFTLWKSRPARPLQSPSRTINTAQRVFWLFVEGWDPQVPRKQNLAFVHALRRLEYDEGGNSFGGLEYSVGASISQYSNPSSIIIFTIKLSTWLKCY